jgi:hypothetical protein
VQQCTPNERRCDHHGKEEEGRKEEEGSEEEEALVREVETFKTTIGNLSQSEKQSSAAPMLAEFCCSRTSTRNHIAGKTVPGAVYVKVIRVYLQEWQFYAYISSFLAAERKRRTLENHGKTCTREGSGTPVM